MAPKIDYLTNKVLTQVFIPPHYKEKDFNKQSKNFIKEFKKIEGKVLQLIEKFSGFKWSKKTIPVYIIPDGNVFSFAKSNLQKRTPGVVQKVYKTPERSTHIFIHELAHINQFQSDFYSKKNSFIFNKKIKNYMNIEICADIVCLHVIRELFGGKSKYEKDYWKFQNKVRTSSPGIEKKIPLYLKKWNLNEKPLKQYIFRV